MMHLRSLFVIALGISLGMIAPAVRAEGNPAPSAWTTTEIAPLTQAQAWTLAQALNKGEADTAKIVAGKAQNPNVKAFAQHMARAHGEAAAAEKETARRLNLRMHGSPQLEQLKAHQRATAQRLSAASKADFDRVYIDAELEAHQQALDLLDRDVLPSATNPEMTADMEALREQIAEHLDEARGLQLELEGG